MSIYLFACALFLAGNVAAQTPNTLTKAEKDAGWQLLFDGKTTAGWHTYRQKTVGAGWQVVDGTLFLSEPAGADDILTDKEYENYEFSVEWKISPCGNSGIIFNVVESEKHEEGYLTGPEMQVIDNACHPDAKFAKHRAGNIYDLFASPTESVKPAGQWNVAKISSNHGHLILWLNDVKQVETTMFTPEWTAIIAGSKFKNYPDFGTARKGRIMLQEHEDKVWYRSIKIRELP